MYAASGDKVRAQSAFVTLVEYSRKNYVSPMNFAACYAARGDKDHAFEWLEKAYQQRATGMIGLSVNHHLENLRSDSRFKDMLRRMRLPDT